MKYKYFSMENVKSKNLKVKRMLITRIANFNHRNVGVCLSAWLTMSVCWRNNSTTKWEQLRRLVKTTTTATWTWYSINNIGIYIFLMASETFLMMFKWWISRLDIFNLISTYLLKWRQKRDNVSAAALVNYWMIWGLPTIPGRESFGRVEKMI